MCLIKCFDPALRLNASDGAILDKSTYLFILCQDLFCCKEIFLLLFLLSSCGHFRTMMTSAYFLIDFNDRLSTVISNKIIREMALYQFLI